MSLAVFSTCPQSADHPPLEYVDRVIEVSKWSEEAGCEGILVYTDNRLADPWLVGQIILQNTQRLSPLIAVQPIYMHPYTLANLITSYGYLYGRRIYLNMVAGGFRNDLVSLCDPTPHDERYDRLVEYIQVIKLLLENSASERLADYAGRYYSVANLKLTPSLLPELMPGCFISGSSPAGLAAVEQTGATCIQYPKPPSEYVKSLPATPGGFGLRVGVIARPESREAWNVGEERFPADRRGELTHQLAMKVSDSAWHRQLSELSEAVDQNSPYWLRPFQHYKTMCPYLVGDYETVAQELRRYVSIGYTTFILDIPPDREELQHTKEVFDRVRSWVSSSSR